MIILRLLALLGFLVSPALAATPIADQFQANMSTFAEQRQPVVAAQPNGEFVIAWRGVGYIAFQRFDSAATAQGGDVIVNPFSETRKDPDIAVDANGNFVVVWTLDSGPAGVFLRRYDASGMPLGLESLVSASTHFSGPSVAADDTGGFMVVWTSADSGQFYQEIQGRRYDSVGAAVGSVFQVNTYTTGEQLFPSVASNASGDFVVVWDSAGSIGTDSSSYSESIQAQRYDSTGAVVGAQFQVNTYTTGNQRQPDVAVAPDGSFSVAWGSSASNPLDTTDPTIRAQRYDSIGATVGLEFQVNTYATSVGRATLSSGVAGDLLITWMSDGSSGDDSSDLSIQAQHYDASGTTIGGEFQVNTYTTGAQSTPELVGLGNGEFVLVWASEGSPESDDTHTVQARRYTGLPEPGGALSWVAALGVIIALRNRQPRARRSTR